MVEGKKIIGVCMTKIHDTPRSRTISFLNEEAQKKGYKIIVFNTSFDFYNGVADEMGAAGIYDYINYDYIDALIILCTGFLDRSIYRDIIKKAEEHSVPVILEDDTDEYCYSVYNSFENTLEQLLNHVIREHGKTETFFIAGIPGNEYSEKRIDIYKKVLADNGLPYKDDMVDYGYFWAGPTSVVVDRLLEREKPLPQAIFCANDAMGIEVCKKLISAGVRVPEDVMVTGFDGSKLSEFASPRLSTCVANRLGFAEKTIQLLTDIFEGKSAKKIIYNDYSLRLSESCGCCDETIVDLRKMAEDNYRLSIDVMGHEHVIFNEIVFLLNSVGMDINTFYSVISNILQNNSCLAIRPSFITSATGNLSATDAYNEELMVVSSKTSHTGITKQAIFNAKEMIPDLKTWTENEDICVINSVQVGKNICGYYINWTNDIVTEAHKMNRVLNMVNMIIHIAVSDMRSRFLKVDRSKGARINPVTELPNLHSLNDWFDNYVSRPENSSKSLSLMIYEIPKYSYIYENYGIQEIETVVCFIAEALKLTNTRNCYIAHIAEDQFLIINYYDKPDTIREALAHSATMFNSVIDNYNLTNGKDYNVDVLSGCGICNIINDIKLESLIRTATGDLIKNKNKSQALPAKKTVAKTSKQTYKLFKTLVEHNLFQYHFQPIVDVKNGEIYGYEALMRTDESIGLNPLEILSIAAEYQRLYDIEKATINNVMARYIAEKEKFASRKVFINSIPGHFLNEDDAKEISAKYSEYIDNFVFEITEQNTITDKELDTIRKLANPDGNNSIAVDDYGTGHSNIINLINYKPEIVKVDRFLMTDIHKDESKQMVVRGVIDFARLNKIKVLAEGIETEDELRKVVELGVDYIQGYFTGRPAYEIAGEIDSEVKNIILDAVKKE